MIDAGTLHEPQTLAGGISSGQGITVSLTILRGDQRIDCAEHTVEPRPDLRQQGQRGFTTTRPHSANTCTVKIKGLGNPGQRGRQKSSMSHETEALHIDGGLGVASPQPAERCGDIAEDLICGSGVLVAPALGQMGLFIGQLQIGRSAGKQRQRKGRMTVGGQAIGHAAHPGIHTKHLRQHDIYTFRRRF